MRNNRAVTSVRDDEISWLRGSEGRAETLGYAIPPRFEVYGALDLSEEHRPNEDSLLEALVPDPQTPLIAGWIDRGPWPPPSGDEFHLYWNWPYRIRRVALKELVGLPSEGEEGFPDLLFPLDHTWLVSLLWDDAWRSIGASEVVARRLEKRIPEFVRLDPSVPLPSTGRHQT